MGSSYWEIIADEIRREGWSIGWNKVATEDVVLWSVDATKGDEWRYVARFEVLAVAMLELQKTTR